MLAHPAIQWCVHTDLEASNGYGAQMSPCHHCVPLPQSQHHVINSANPSGALNDSIQDRLNVRGRTADDTEHLGSGSLMLQGFTQFSVALLDLFEQPHVFDGDHRLGCEGFQKRNLLLSERLDL